MADDFSELCRFAGEAAVEYRMIADGDRILVGASGGKDSFMLLHVLEHLRQAAPVKFTFVAATFDPGYDEFDAPGISGYCRAHGWKHRVVELDIAGIIAEKKWEKAPCVLCSRLRRGKLYGLCRELGCNKLALGHHFDDLATSFLISLCRGQGLSTMAPVVPPKSPDKPTIIRPLALAPEALIARCADAMQVPRFGLCRYREQLGSGDRKYFRDLVDTLAERIPDLRSNLRRSLARVEHDHLLLLPDGKRSKTRKAK